MIADETTKGPNYPIDSQSPDQLLSVSDAVKESGQTENRIKRHLKLGYLPHQRLGGPGSWRVIRRGDLMEWAANLTPSGFKDRG